MATRPLKLHVVSKSSTKPQERKNANERGYTYRWQKAAKKYLSEHPWCAACLKENWHTLATEVDHKRAHRGNPLLFWDEENWQGLCHSCHSRKTVQEDGGLGARTSTVRKTTPPTPEK